MIKRMLTVLLAVGVITFVALGVSNKAKADTGVYDGVYSCSNFRINLLDPVYREGGSTFIYEYTINSGALDISKMSYVYFGVDADLQISTDDPEKLSIIPAGVGTPDGWLAGVPQLQILGIKAQEYTESTPLVIKVSGSGGNTGLSTAFTKAGNKVEACYINAPVQGLPIDVTIPLTKQVNLNGVDYCIDVDPQTGCPYPNSDPYVCGIDPKVYLSPDDNFVLGSTEGDPEGPVYPTMIMGEGSDPRCPVAKAAHNPCQWIILSGRPYGPVCW